MADLAPDVPTSSLRLEPDQDPSTEALVSLLTQARFLGEHVDPETAEQAARTFVDRVLPNVRRHVLRDASTNEQVGEVWLVPEGEDLGVLGLSLALPRHAAAAREAILGLARAQGFARVSVGVVPGDPVLEEIGRGRSVEVAAFQMRLDLSIEPQAETGLVDLVAMDQATYDSYMLHSVADYTAERQRAGESPERAALVAESQMAALLPAGLATPDQHFFSAVVGGERVGLLWLGTERPLAFVYDVVIEEAYRRRGHGAALMRAGAGWARDHGSHALGLNVFGFNHGAKVLYEHLGFRVVEERVLLALDHGVQDR